MTPEAVLFLLLLFAFCAYLTVCVLVEGLNSWR